MIPKETSFLVVDDISVMRNITVSLLRGAKLERIVTAANGKEALQLLERQRVDIVLSDWNMPVMSGLELLKALRKNPRTADIPFLMITVDAARERVSEAIAAGVTDLLVKPYTSGQLLDRIERVFSRRRVAPLDQPATATPLKSAQSPTVLVVDDTPTNLQLNYELLKDEFRVRTASSGQKALDICHSDTPPDLVLLDVVMPGMDGFEVARRLREHPNSETIPVIFVTAKTDPESQMKALEIGAVDFVAKPIDPAILLPRVRNFMRYVALQKQLQANYDAMMEAVRLRADVEQILGHDIRGPLHGIAGLAEKLASGPGAGADEREQAVQILASATDLLDAVTMSCEIVKIERGNEQLACRPVDLGALLGRIASAAAGKGIEIALETRDSDNVLMAYGDPSYCHSLFRHLIEGLWAATALPMRIGAFSHGLFAHVAVTLDGAVPATVRDAYFKKPAGDTADGAAEQEGYKIRLLAEAQGGQVEMNASDAENRTIVTVRLPKA